MLQTLTELLLLLRIEVLERGIVVQSALLFRRRHVFVTAQPISRVSSARWRNRLLGPWRLLHAGIRLRARRWGVGSLLSRRWCGSRRLVRGMVLRRAPGCNCQARQRHGNDQSGHRDAIPNVSPQFHVSHDYGFATTFCCTSRSSSTSKSAYKSLFLSRASKSLTAVPGSGAKFGEIGFSLAV